MADFSIVTYTASGAPNVQYAVPFPYISRDHVQVLTNYDKSTGTFSQLLPVGSGFNWVNGTTIQIPTLAAGTVFSIVRRTPEDQPLVDWVAGGGALTADELRLSSLQTLYVVQEGTDRGFATAADSGAAAIQAAQAAAEAAQAAADAALAKADATSALGSATDAENKADAAVAAANAASSASWAATNTANEALATANAASSTATAADSTANAANDKADAAIAAIASSVSYTGVANVAAIPGAPANNTYIEVLDATGLESFTPLTGIPVGFVGDSGLKVRLRYTTVGNTWVWIDYSAKDADGRYVQETAISTSTSSSSTTTVASSSAVKAAKDAADAAQSTADGAASTASAAQSAASAAQSAANTANATANAALPKAGGTMTGAITFAGAQTFPAASTSSPGVVQLSTANNSTSTTQAATPSAVKSVQDFAQVVSNTANAAMPKTGGTFTGDIAVPSINGGPLAGFRSAIVNGSFDHWQRGTSQTTGGYGSADRWRMNPGGTFEFSRQPFTLGQTAVPGNPKYHARMSVTVAPSSSNTNFSQRIEGVDTFAGQQVTLSFWAKANATRTIWAGHFQNYGTGGSPSAATNTDGGYFTLTTSWQRFSLTTTLPSVSGKTLGTDGNDHLTCHFIVSNDTTGFAWSSVPAQTGTFDFAQIQLEAGPVATPFERRPIGVELALCQRYHYRCDGQIAGAVGYKSASAAAAGWFNAAITYPVKMRSTPNFTWDSPALSNCTEGTHVITEDGATLRINTSAAAFCRMQGGTLIFDAEL